MQHLAELLSISRPTAVGILELLFHFTAEFAPQGNIGKYDDKRIEAALESWFRPAGKLVAVLQESGWIERDDISRLVVHDWHDHCDQSVKKRLERSNLKFLSLRPKVSGQSRTLSASESDLPLPEPLASARAISGSEAVNGNHLHLYGRYAEVTGNWTNDKRGVDLGAQMWISLVDSGEITEANVTEVLEGLTRWKNSDQWKKSNGQFVPNIANWLSRRAWKDHPKPAAKDDW